MNDDDIATSEELIHTLWSGFESGFDRYKVIRTGERQPVPLHVRREVLYRDKRRCQWCASTRQLQLDHIIPWSAGGPDEASNLRLLCADCNKLRSNYVADSDLVEIRPNPHSREHQNRLSADQSLEDES